MSENIKNTCWMAEELGDYEFKSFKFLISSFGHCLSLQDQIDRIHKFDFLNLKGTIDLNNPEFTLVYFEQYDDLDNRKRSATDEAKKPLQVYFGILVSKGTGSSIVEKYDLKQRKYIGTTSMDAELSLISANQALARPGSLIYDPFVGTGSFLISSSHFGACTLGSDIDGRKQQRIKENIEQYGMESLILGTFCGDLAHHPWRTKAKLFDAIVCDPPYGVREGAKKITPTNDSPFKRNGELRYPKMEPYNMANIIVDLIELSALHLKVGGRLVFWLPTVNEFNVNQDIPSHPALVLVSSSEQVFGKWSRRLITMEKVSDNFDMEGLSIECKDVPSITEFRDKYFTKSK